MNQLIDKIIDFPWPIGYGLFRDVGASGFSQSNGSDSLNIAFRSEEVESSDGYRIDFIEFRVSPQLDRGVTFLYVKFNGDSCYPASTLKATYALQPLLFPPNPHDASSRGSKGERLYVASGVGGTARFRATEDGQGCLLSLSRNKDQ